MADMTFKANLIPASNDYYNLGTATGAINKYWRLAVNNITSVPSTNLFGGICFTDSNTAVLSKINTSPFINIRLQSNNWCAIELGKPRECSGFLHLWHKSSDYSTILYPRAPSTTQVQIQLPDESGLVALTNSANSGYVRKTGDTMTGQLYINYDQDVGLDQNGSLIIGSKTGENIGIDGNEIMARKNSAASPLHLNYSGGAAVYIGSGGLQSSGNISTSTFLISNRKGVGEAQCKVISNAGEIYLYSQGSANANRGIYGINASGTSQAMFGWDQNGSIYSGGALFGAVWNDYAEFRETKEEIEPGRCIREVGDDTLVLTNERLQRGCEIVSDTFGFSIGQSKKCKTPTAASGRVLAYPYESLDEFKKHIGYCVCSGPNGTVSIMTEEEEKEYPGRIIGTISAVPNYEIWIAGTEENPEEIKVNGRVWIRIR